MNAELCLKKEQKLKRLTLDRKSCMIHKNARKETIIMATKKAINLKWTNIFSGETGYVKSIQKKKGYFENTFDQTEARKFKSRREAAEAIEVLETLGEAVTNKFEIVVK